MKRCQPWLGTHVEIRAEGLNTPLLQKAIDDAFIAIQYIHRLMSFHDPMSDLSALNLGAHDEPIKIHPWTYQVLEQGLALHHATNGLFDCAIAPTLIKWKYLPTRYDWENRSGSMRHMQLLPGNEVFFSHPLTLDLGGIAKGFAVDQAISVLENAGVTQAVINAGGDLRVLGDHEETITVRHQEDPTQFITIGKLTNGAAATSSLYFSNTESNLAGSTLVDPRSLMPIRTKASYTIMAESCLIADGLTKALAIEGLVDAPYLAHFRAKGIIST